VPFVRDGALAKVRENRIEATINYQKGGGVTAGDTKTGQKTSSKTLGLSRGVGGDRRYGNIKSHT